MAWIACDLTLPTNPKTLDLADMMGWNPYETVGRLLQMWGWCLTFADDGDLKEFPAGRIAQGIGLPPVEGDRVVRALVQAGWIDEEPYLRIHDWWTMVGRFLRGRYSKESQIWKRVERLYKTTERAAETGLDPLTTSFTPGRDLVVPTVQYNTEHNSTEHPPPHPVRENDDDGEGFEKLRLAIWEKTSLRSLSRSDEQELKRLVRKHGERAHDASQHLHSGVANVTGYLKVILEGKSGPDTSVERFKRLLDSQGLGERPWMIRQ